MARMFLSLALIVMLPSIVFAQDIVPAKRDSDEKACIKSRGLTEEQLSKGSFKLLLRDCVGTRRKEQQKNDRLWRLNQRTLRVQERMTRNSKAFLIRRFGVRDDPKNFLEEKSQAAQLRYRESLPYGRSYLERPSRRSLHTRSVISNPDQRKNSSSLFQDRQRHSIEFCSHLTRRFERDNCVRAKMRELGSQSR